MLVKLYTLVSAVLLVSVGITSAVISQIDIVQEQPIFGCGTVSPMDHWNDSFEKSLFTQYCTACHKYDVKSLGPALAGIGQRRSRKWIINWVHDSQAFIESGDSLAIAVSKENGPAICAPFPFLTEKDIDGLIGFLDQY